VPLERNPYSLPTPHWKSEARRMESGNDELAAPFQEETCEMKVEACYSNKCHWNQVLIQYRPRSGKAKLDGWKDNFTNLFY